MSDYWQIRDKLRQLDNGYAIDSALCDDGVSGYREKQQLDLKRLLDGWFWHDRFQHDDYGDPDELAHMPYQEFLATAYWKILTYVMREVYDRCQRCYSRGKLHVHHKTYEHRGREWQYPEDLIVVCEICHYKLHHPDYS